MRKFGGNQNRQVAIPHPDLTKKILMLQKLWEHKNESFSDFQITIEATHHGPTAS